MKAYAQFLLVLRDDGRVESHFGRQQRGHRDELEVRIADQLASEPQERFLEIVVRLGTDVIVLQVLLPVERDRLGFHLAVLHVHLIKHT